MELHEKEKKKEMAETHGYEKCSKLLQWISKVNVLQSRQKTSHYIPTWFSYGLIYYLHIFLNLVKFP